MLASELIQKLVEIVAESYDMEVVVGIENADIKEVTTDGFRHGRAILIQPVSRWEETNE